MLESAPVFLQALKTGAELKGAWSKWRAQSHGKAKLLIAELRNNLRFCTLVLDDELDIGEAMHVLSTQHYDRLAGEDPDLKSLSPRKIKNLGVADDAKLASWQGRRTVELVDNIYEKIKDIQVFYPNPKSRKNRRWSVRVINIRNRILLLLANAGAGK